MALNSRFDDREAPERAGDPESSEEPRGPRELWHQYKKLTRLSFPKSFPIIQFPNAPLIVGFIAGMLASRLHGDARDYARAVAYLATGLWAYLELTEGVNWFRNLLGLAYVISTLVHLALALKH
jgi:hypothetical protein